MESETLRPFIERHARILVLTGAGCSTDSGIPDYRDSRGHWKRSARPVTLQSFVNDIETRRRYWARSLSGWPLFRTARPNAAHRALALLQRQGRIELLVTQNVDRLHQAAGSTDVLDLHGRLDQVRCLSCDARLTRDEIQIELLARNARWPQEQTSIAPDGDAELPATDLHHFEIPCCPHCGGILKPDVVFFGESVPPERVDHTMRHLEQADAMLVIGSSLMLYSGYRFVRQAAELGKPIAAVNLGRTRADELLSLKLAEPCSAALAFLLEQRSQAA